MGYHLQSTQGDISVKKAKIKLKTLQDQIKTLEDLKRQHEIAAFRYYASDACETLVKLIMKEIENWPETEIIPEDIYISLGNVERLIVNDISGLCKTYRKVILMGAKYSN